MDYHLAVPSYRRARLFGNKTYNFLKLSHAPLPVVYVADQQDYNEYKTLYPELDIRIAMKGLCNVRNFILHEQPLGKKIVMMDDDIEDVYCLDLSTQKPKKRRVRDFSILIANAFLAMNKAGTTFWGVHPTDNGLTMKPVIRRNLCYCVGAFFGLINQRIEVSLDYAEDFERTLKYWNKEGRLCRLEFVGISTKYYVNEGGLQETRNEILNTEQKHLLAEQYSSLCKAIKRKGRTELKFRRFPTHFISCSMGGNEILEQGDDVPLVLLPLP